MSELGPRMSADACQLVTITRMQTYSAVLVLKGMEPIVPWVITDRLEHPVLDELIELLPL